MNITEDYISFEIAKLLKEKGFAERVDACYAVFCEYEKDIRVLNLDPRRNAQTLKDGRYPFVTQQFVLKWLREVHRIEIHIVLSELHADNNRKYMVDIFSSDINKNFDNIQEDGFNSYEEACETGIKYTLENLI